MKKYKLSSFSLLFVTFVEQNFTKRQRKRRQFVLFHIQGSVYNYKGERERIWTDDTREKFTKLKECFREQYLGYDGEDGNRVDHLFTIDENLADNGGVIASYYAWEKWKKDNTNHKSYSLPGIDFTDEQLFYFGWASTWFVYIYIHFCMQCTRQNNAQYIGAMHSPTIIIRNTFQEVSLTP